MKKINKKGDAKSLLIELIVIIMVLGAIVIVMIKISNNADEATQEILCRSSVILRGKASVALVDDLVEFEKITPLACHTTDLGTLKGSREEVKKQIADYSSMCWWKFAEGSVADLFKVDRKEKACFVCYTFSIDNKLDKGVSSRQQIFTEPSLDVRTNAISSYELTNFLVSEAYNPGIIYGGGSNNYFGTSYNYALNVGIGIGKEPTTIKPSKINSLMVNGYVKDYSYMITEDTKNKINEIGVELQKANAGNIFVVVAEEFKSMENSDARGIIENTGLNSNDTTYDAILIMLDLNKQTMRIHLGADQSIFIKEYELNDIMKKNFDGAFDDAAKNNLCASKSETQCNLEIVNKALLESVTDVSNKLINKANQLQGVSPKSYYYYLTNAGYTWTTIYDIEAPERYAITYVAVSDEASFAKFNAFINAINKPFNALTNGMFGTRTTKTERPQLILITSVNDLGNQCTMVE